MDENSDLYRSPERSGSIFFRVGMIRVERKSGASLNAVFGHRFTPLINLGIGVSWEATESYSFASAYLNPRIIFFKGRISPYVSGDIGYTSMAPGGSREGEFLFCGGGGIEIGLTPFLGFVVGADARKTYSHFQGNIVRFYGGLDYSFRKSGSPFKKTKRPVLRSTSSAGQDDKKTELMLKGGGSFMNGDPGFNLGIMPMFNINPLTEIGVGLGWDEYEMDSFISLFFAGRHFYNEEKISPFLTCEAGYALEMADGVSSSETKGPLISIGIGVNYSPNLRNSIFVQADYKAQWSKRFLVSYYDIVETKDVNFNIFRVNGGVSF